LVETFMMKTVGVLAAEGERSFSSQPEVSKEGESGILKEDSLQYPSAPALLTH
jgi:hypothetical protein